MVLRAILLASLAVGVGACSRGDTFQCRSSDQCMSDVVEGVCQQDGWCSFPDDECGSGQRYGQLAGDGLAGQCVPVEVDTEAPPGTSTSTSTSTSSASATSLGDTGSDTQVVPDLGGIDPFCGDGNVDADEECDDGNPIDDDACSNACTAARCGDGIVQVGEGCDNGSNNDNRGECILACQIAACGDGFVQEGVEQCDGTDLDGNDCTGLGFPGGGEPTCTSACTLDPTTCDACTMMGMECNGFVPCDEQTLCPGDSECFFADAMGTGTCIPACMSDDECSDYAPTWPTMCLMESGCVIDCTMTQSCPTGMTCQDVMGVIEICLW